MSVPPIDRIDGPGGHGGAGGAGTSRWRGPHLAALLAGLGAVAFFGALSSEWVVERIPDATEFEVSASFTHVGGWGSAWLAGMLGLMVAAGLSLAGPPAVRPAARVAGLSLAGALLLTLLAASIEFSQRGGTVYAVAGVDNLESTVGRGVYAGFAAVALLAAAMWLVEPAARPAAGYPVAGTAGGYPVAGVPSPRQAPVVRPEQTAGRPGELTVGPAEPFVHPTDGHEWR